MAEISQPTIEQDIAELERQLEEKKAALGQEKTEKEVFKEILKERIDTHVPDSQELPSLPEVQAQQEELTPPSYLSEDQKAKVREIVDIVLSKNLDEGIKVLKSGNPFNPAVVDAFHDLVTDELYDKLIEKRKLDRVE